jgi:hypothetical protein
MHDGAVETAFDQARTPGDSWPTNNEALDRLLESGDRLVGEWLGPFEDSVATFRLGTGSSDSDTPVADLLTLEVHGPL